MKVGCLTRIGGVGIHISNLTEDDLHLNIQIDPKGHIFPGYDKTGLTLKMVKEAE